MTRSCPQYLIPPTIPASFLLCREDPTSIRHGRGCLLFSKMLSLGTISPLGPSLTDFSKELLPYFLPPAPCHTSLLLSQPCPQNCFYQCHLRVVTSNGHPLSLSFATLGSIRAVAAPDPSSPLLASTIPRASGCPFPSLPATSQVCLSRHLRFLKARFQAASSSLPILSPEIPFQTLDSKPSVTVPAPSGASRPGLPELPTLISTCLLSAPLEPVRAKPKPTFPPLALPHLPVSPAQQPGPSSPQVLRLDI